MSYYNIDFLIAAMIILLLILQQLIRRLTFCLL